MKEYINWRAESEESLNLAISNKAMLNITLKHTVDDQDNGSFKLFTFLTGYKNESSVDRRFF